MSKRRRVSSTHKSLLTAALLVGMVVMFLVAGFFAVSAFTSVAQPSPTPHGTTFSVRPLPSQQSTAPTKPPTTAVPTDISTSSTPSPSQVAAKPLAAVPLRLVYAVVGIDLPIAPLNQESGLLDPPAVKESSYWLNQFGQPGEQAVNTTYLIAHSGELGGWPFNALSISSQIGDIIEVHTENGVVSFQVTNVDAYSKTMLQDNTKTPVWDIDGKRLVLISCKSGDVWQQNIVVTATML